MNDLKDLNDSIDAITAATALGMQLHAPEGTTAWGYVRYFLDEEETSNILYSTEEAVYAALQNEVMASWVFNSSTPWEEANQTSTEWASNKTDKEIVDSYYKRYPGEHLAVVQYTIAGKPERHPYEN